MSDTGQRDLDIGDPAPLRHRGSGWALSFALFAGPFLWIVQLVGGFAFTSYLCFGGLPREAAAAPGWLPGLVSAANVAALIVAAVSIAVAVGELRRTRSEHGGQPGGALDAGEGRTRFLAIWGVATGALFLLAIGFNTMSLLLVTTCPA